VSDPTRIVVAGRARIYLAPLGTVAPTDDTVAMPTGWVDVGLTDPDSLAFEDAPTFGEVTSHQSDYSTRVFQTGAAATLAVDLQEYSQKNLTNVYGGGTLTTITAPSGGNPGHYMWTPPAIGGRTNVAACAEIVDGTKRYRYMIPNCMDNQAVSQKLAKKANVVLPLRLQILGSDGVAPYYLLTNDPAFAPGS